MLSQARTWATVAGAAVLVSTLASAQNYCDDYEVYPAAGAGAVFTPGGLPNAGGWYQWDLAVNNDTLCYDATGPILAQNGSQYIGTQLNADTIKVFNTGAVKTYIAGHWNICVWTYVPGPASATPMLDSQWAVFLNDYNDLGPYEWATQVDFDPLTGSVLVDNGISLTTCAPQFGVGAGLVFDAWKKLKIDVNLDLDIAQVYYDGGAVGDPFSWSQGPFGNNGGAGLPCPPPAFSQKAIHCFDWYANSTALSPSFMYWDDVEIKSKVPPPIIKCPANASAGGCTVDIAATDNPSLTNTTVCVVTVSNLEGARNGLILYGVNRPAGFQLPWNPTSMLCVKSPTQRTPGWMATGNLGVCDGGPYSLDFNAHRIANPTALWSTAVVGDTINFQGWYRETSAKTTGMTDAVEVTLMP